MASMVMGLFTAMGTGGGLLATGSAALTGMQGLMTAGSVLSSVVGGISAYNTGQTQQEWANLNAQGEELKSRDAAVGIRKDMLRNLASQRVAFAGSGVDISYGTPETLYQDTLNDGQYNIDMTMNNGAIAAAGQRYRGQQAANRGALSALRYGVKGVSTAGRYLTDISRRG